MTTKPKPESVPEPAPESDFDISPFTLRGPVNESPVSANVFVISPAGGNYQFTFRSHATEQDFYNVLGVIGLVEATLADSGWTFKQIGAPAGQVPSKAPASHGQALPPAGAPLPPPAGAPAGQSQGNKDDNTFPALELVGEVKSGKVYWAVTSAAAYPKFPTRIWREPLEEVGTDIEALNPTMTYKLTGYTAVFARNENGNPSKVTKLIPPPAPV